MGELPDLVSIIIPIFNRSEFLPRALGSVIRQTYHHIELILVDDGSSEDISSVIMNVMTASPLPFQLIRQQNSGPGVARRVGLLRARGKYIVYLDSDDELHPIMVENLLNMLNDSPNALMACCRYQYGHQNNMVENDLSFWLGMDMLELALNARPWATAACMWRYPDRSKILWPSLYASEDIVHDISVGVQGQIWIHLPKTLVNIYSHSGRLSSMEILRSNYERVRLGIVESRMAISQLLQENELNCMDKYAIPFYERCLRGVVQLAVMGAFDSALDILKLMEFLKISPFQRFQSVLLKKILSGKYKFPTSIYLNFFEFHRAFTPASIHANKKIRTL